MLLKGGKITSSDFQCLFFVIFYIRNVMQPKVSIVLPIYGVEKYLDRCMDRDNHGG